MRQIITPPFSLSLYSLRRLNQRALRSVRLSIERCPNETNNGCPTQQRPRLSSRRHAASAPRDLTDAKKENPTPPRVTSIEPTLYITPKPTYAQMHVICHFDSTDKNINHFNSQSETLKLDFYINIYITKINIHIFEPG